MGWDTSLFRDCNTGAETVKTCMELVEQAKRVLSPTDPLIASALDALARAQEGQCLYQLAIPVRHEALALYLAVYGPDSKDALSQEEKLIDAYRKAKKLDDAIRLQRNRFAVRGGSQEKNSLSHMLPPAGHDGRPLIPYFCER